MATWPMAAAKAKFSEVVENAVHDAPQQITKNGKPVTVLISLQDWLERQGDRDDQRTTADLFRTSPLMGSGLVIRRAHSRVRDVTL